jgi:hypothetical protein
MVERMLMVLFGIMVSQPMLLFVGGDAGAGERFVEPKLLEWLRSGFVPWRGGGDRLLLECGGLDCCVFVEDGGGSGRLKGGVALAPDPVLMKLGGLLRPMVLIGLDPALRGWWLSQFVNASWLGVSSALMSGPTAGAPLLQQRRRFVLDSCGDGKLQQYSRLYPPYVMLLVCVPTLYRDVYGRTS